MIQTVIAGKHWLAPPAAVQYLRMLADGCPAGVSEAGRTRERQEWLYEQWMAGLLDIPSIARPGTSKHETGTALDLPEPARTWVTRNGARYGWIAGRVPGEPWHFEFDASRVTASTPKPSAPVAAPNLQGETMRAVATPSGRRFVLGELTYQDMSAHWDHASHEAHVWNSDTAGEPQVIADATLDLAVGQIQQRRAQLAEALKFHGV